MVIFALYLLKTSAVPEGRTKYKGVKRNMKQNKGMRLGALLAAMLLMSMAFVPAVSAQENLVNSRDLASKYQNTNWDTVQLLATSYSSDITDELFFLKKGDKVKYLEIIDDGGNLQTKEITPSLISSVRNEKVLSTKSVQDERNVAETIRISGEKYYEISGTILSVTVKEAWNTVEAKNILGDVLFSLTASGWFHYNAGVEVLYVADDSSAYANGWYGWSVESFSSSASWNTQIGTVNANAQFDHVIFDERNAWSQIQVDKDGKLYQDGAIY